MEEEDFDKSASEKNEDKLSEGMSTSSSSLVLKSRRKGTIAPRIVIEIPSSENNVTSCGRSISIYGPASPNDDTPKSPITSSLSRSPTSEKNLRATIAVLSNEGKDTFFDSDPKIKPGSPRREPRNLESTSHHTSPSFSEVTSLLYKERDMFRNCALEILDQMDKMTSNSVRLGNGAEIIKCGLLRKKQSGNPLCRWKEKYVIITIGKLIWYPVTSKMRELGDYTIDNRLEQYQHEMVLNENTEPRCSLSREKNIMHVFDVSYVLSDYIKVITKPSQHDTRLDISTVDELKAYIRSTSSTSSEQSLPSPAVEVERIVRTDDMSELIVEKHFMCNSDEERESWLRAIRVARLGRYNDPKMWSSQHIFTAVRSLIHNAQSVDVIERILDTITNCPLRVPVHFIQSMCQGCRGPLSDPQLIQVMKDLNRETVQIGTQTFQSTLGDCDTYGFSSKILYLLMKSIRKCDSSLKDFELMRFAKNVLLHTYRSQTGGDCLDALIEFMSNSDLVKIRPTQNVTVKNPIVIDVSMVLPSINDNMYREGPYVKSSIVSLFTVVDSKKNSPLFSVRTCVESIIIKENSDDNWTLEIVFTRC